MTERPAAREWLAFLIDWMVLGIVWFLGFVLFALVVYAVLPAGMRFVTVAVATLGTMLASIHWLLFSARVAPRSVGRRLVGAAQPVSAWDAVRGRGIRSPRA